MLGAEGFLGVGVQVVVDGVIDGQGQAVGHVGGRGQVDEVVTDVGF